MTDTGEKTQEMLLNGLLRTVTALQQEGRRPEG